MNVTTQNSRGEWVPAVPEPLFLRCKRVECSCGRRFRDREAYRGHFALVHILGMEGTR